MPRDYQISETTISAGNLTDLIAAFLYQTQTVNDHDNVVDLSISPPNPKGFRVVRYITIKNKEPDLIVHA